MQIIDYVDLYLGALLNIMFYGILIRKIFKVKRIKNIKIEVLALLMSSLFVSIINIYNKDVFKVLVTIPFVTFGMKYIFNLKLDKAFLYVLAGTFYLFIGEIIVGIIFSTLPVDYVYTFNNILGRTIGNIAVIICTTPFMYIGLLSKLFRVIFDNPKISKRKVVVVAVLFLMLISAMTYKNTTGVTDIISTMMNGIIFVVIACIAYSLYKESEKTEEISDNYNVLLTYLEKYETELVEKRKVIHDYKNEIIVINGYIGDDEKLREYVGEIMEEQKKMKESASLRNIDKLPRGLKGLIYYKLSHIEEDMMVDMEVKGDMKKFDKIPPRKSKEILKIVGILIDNAIEAVEKEEKKYIDISFEIKKNKFEMIMENTCTNSIKEKELMNEGYSTKGKGRGYGLPIINDIIKKDNSYTLDIDIDDDIFSTTLIVTI